MGRKREAVDWTFADWLRLELDSRQMGVRTLARAIVDAKLQGFEALDVETVRRTLTRYMTGTWPSAHYAGAIAHVFEISLESIPTKTQEEDAA